MSFNTSFLYFHSAKIYKLLFIRKKIGVFFLFPKKNNFVLLLKKINKRINLLVKLRLIVVHRLP